MVEEPVPRVTEGPPAESVEPAMMYWEWEFGVMVSVPIVKGAGFVPEAEGSKEVRGP